MSNIEESSVESMAACRACGASVEGALETCANCGTLLTSFESDSLELNENEVAPVLVKVSSDLGGRIEMVRKLLEARLSDPKQSTKSLMHSLNALKLAEELVGKSQIVEAERLVVEAEQVIAPPESEKPPQTPRRRRIIIGPMFGVFITVLWLLFRTGVFSNLVSRFNEPGRDQLIEQVIQGARRTIKADASKDSELDLNVFRDGLKFGIVFEIRFKNAGEYVDNLSRVAMQNLVIEELINDPEWKAIKEMLKRDIYLKYVYRRVDGSIFIAITITKTEIEEYERQKSMNGGSF